MICNTKLELGKIGRCAKIWSRYTWLARRICTINFSDLARQKDQFQCDRYGKVYRRIHRKRELYAEKVNNRGLCAIAQAESLRYKLLGGLAVRRACYGVLRFVMESGAKGCEVIVSGKLRAQRAKSMKFKDGYMISSGQPVKDYIDSAVRHVLLRQGVLGIKVKIMLDWDPKGKQGPKTPLPDIVTIHTPKEEEEYVRPAAVVANDIEVPLHIIFKVGIRMLRIHY
ncbi:40S ribosomal protein S3-3 [Lathyrus oleraceus]|uniref:40S ribosomal protein S3-3 n=1 Tax=Pisum sativum TaxID=3888 RepID=A0A9D5A4V2_PEA|nr:40S ribosomal protein S3-3 [Pisum sativum]